MPKHDLIQKLRWYAQLMRIDRPIGTLLLLWPTLWALWVAGAGHPDPLITLIFIVGVFLMRSAGCVINDYADRELDPHVRRTASRPLASGKVTAREALTLFGVLGLLAFGLVLLLNPLTIALSTVGIALAASYPFMKRFTYLPQVHLGVAFGWAVPMAFAAQTGTIPTEAWLLLIAVVLWAVAYDTMYAMVDKADDLRIGVKSTAILFGESDRAWICGIQLGVLSVLCVFGVQAQLGFWYYVGVMVAGSLFVYQQRLIREREPKRCFQAFLNNNWLGATVFLGILLNYWLGR